MKAIPAPLTGLGGAANGSFSASAAAISVPTMTPLNAARTAGSANVVANWFDSLVNVERKNQFGGGVGQHRV